MKFWVTVNTINDLGARMGCITYLAEAFCSVSWSCLT